MACITSYRSYSSVRPVRRDRDIRVFVVATDALRYLRRMDRLIPEPSIHKAKMKKVFPRNIRHIPLALGYSILTFAGLVLMTDGQATAQTTVYTDQYGNPTVSVDLRALDALGPEPNLPDLYRKTAPLPSRPVMARRPATADGGGGRELLAPPPRSMPRSKLNLPANLLPARPPARQVAPPPPANLSSTPKPRTRAAPLTKPSVAPPPRPKIAARTPPPPAPLSAPKAPRSRLSTPRVPKAPPPLAAPTRALPAPVAPVSRRPVVAPPPKTALASPTIQPPRPITAPAPMQAPPPLRTPAPSVAAPQARPTASLATPTSQGRQPAVPVGNITISPDGNLYSIPFGPGSDELLGSATPALSKLAQRMNSDENIRIQLMGFAAAGGSSASQARRRSLFRALAIRTYLMKEGVRSTRMDVRALGQTSVQGVPPDRVDIVVQKQ
jgi:outer membrane protein OmpA-like peptidoglycan-associated protein